MKRLHSHTQLVGLHRVNWTLIDWLIDWLIGSINLGIPRLQAWMMNDAMGRSIPLPKNTRSDQNNRRSLAGLRC
jgi:hypothetical protein